MSSRLLRLLTLWLFTSLFLSLCSCSSLVYRHLPEKNVSTGQRDSLNHQMNRAVVHIITKELKYQRKPGFVRLQHDTLLVASSVLFDTLRLALDSVVSIRCIEDLPLGTTIAATAGGALGGFLIGKAAVSKSNSDFPFGMGVVGGVLGCFAAIESSRETVYIIGANSKTPTK